MKIETIRIYRYDIPFVRPFVTSRFILQNRSGLILELTTTSGQLGYGEIAPLPGFSRETIDDCAVAAVALVRELRHAELPDSPQALQLWSRSHQGLPPCVIFGFESAVADLCAQATGITMAQWLRPNATQRVALNAVIAGNTTDSDIKAKCVEGYSTFKLKIGSTSIDEDVRRISEIRELIGSSAKLRLDANCAYDFESATKLIQHLAAFNIEYIEEPLKDATLANLAHLRNNSPIPIAIDETLISIYNRALDTRRINLRAPEFLDSFDVAIIKPSQMGSIIETIEFCERLIQSGKKIVVTSSLDTAIGVTTAIHIACALQVRDACGLDTAGLFVSQLTHSIGDLSAGYLSLPSRPGLGVALEKHPDNLQYLNEIEVA